MRSQAPWAHLGASLGPRTMPPGHRNILQNGEEVMSLVAGRREGALGRQGTHPVTGALIPLASRRESWAAGVG